MPRYESNNPTARIGNILDDFDDLNAAYELIANVAAEHAPAQIFESLPPKPVPLAVEREKMRRHLTGAKVTYKRNYMRLIRAGGGPRTGGPRVAAVRPLTPEEEAAIMAEVDRDLGGA